MKNLLLCIYLFVLPLSFGLKAQQDSIATNQEEKIKLFEVIDIEISGENKYSKEQIEVYSNIRIGDFIQPKGTIMASGIKKLWATHLFSDIQVFLTPINENQVKLRYHLMGFPVINELKVNGLSKSKTKDLIKDLALKEGKTITPEIENKIKN